MYMDLLSYPSPFTSHLSLRPCSAPRLPREAVIVPGLFLPHSRYLLCPLPGHPFSGLSTCFLHFPQVSAQTPPFQRRQGFFNPLHSLRLILPGLSAHSACLAHTTAHCPSSPNRRGDSQGRGVYISFHCWVPSTQAST